MSLAFYDSTYTAMGSDVLRSFHDGRLGGSWESIIYLRNSDPSRYFTNLELSYTVLGYEDFGEFGSTGWGVKFLYGQRQPTQAEWDSVQSTATLMMPDIGSTSGADVSTYHPIWVKFICPGNQAAQIRENQKIELSFYERLIGS